MSVRFASAFATIVTSSVLIAQTSAAQAPKPTSVVQPSTSAPTEVIRILQTEGTREEQPQIDAITTRLKTRLTTDATVTKRVDDALAKRDYTTARALFAEVAQVRADQVFIGSKPVLGPARPDRPTLRLASMERSNPFVIFFIYKGVAVCIGSDFACAAAFRNNKVTPAT